jgi:hypothetical protein
MGNGDNMALHSGDVVREIATNRPGTINYTKPTYWRVQFSDGQEPLLKIFKHEAELRLVACPHSNTDPSFVLERGIMGFWNRLTGRH